MIIMLEGPEAAGKSTLGSNLSLSTGWPLVHRDKPKTAADRIEMMAYYTYAVTSKENLIFDRCWYSEIVYGNIMRDKSYISYDQMYFLEEQLAKRGGGLIIHCTDRIDLLWGRCQVRGEDYIKDIDTLNNICDMYHHILHYMPHKIPVVRHELSKNMYKV